MASIYLVRHGQASFGTADYDRISNLGAAQSQLAGEYLRCAGGRIEMILCGTLVRQRQTAALIASALNTAPPGRRVSVEMDARLNEFELEQRLPVLLPILETSPGPLAALAEEAKTSSKSFQKLIKRVFLHWQSLEQPLEGMPPWSEFAGRVKAVIGDAMARSSSGGSAILVTSGGVIACAIQQALDLPAAGTYGLFEVIRNCSITHLLHDRQRLSLASFNESSYLSATAGGFNGNQRFTYR
jgi:broad specificity phosphatase PhoE